MIVPVGRSQPTRIVSLVPSISEALFVLGLGGRVVGITRFCVHPAKDVEAVRKVGGTKDPDIDTIVRLAPDLVIANREENTERVVRRLEAAGLRVWVTYPRSVREGVALLREDRRHLGLVVRSSDRIGNPVTSIASLSPLTQIETIKPTAGWAANAECYELGYRVSFATLRRVRRVSDEMKLRVLGNRR